jgi:hypothetical protein
MPPPRSSPTIEYEAVRAFDAWFDKPTGHVVLGVAVRDETASVLRIRMSRGDFARSLDVLWATAKLYGIPLPREAGP